jgi:flagellar biosynthesis/type III secretory pathway protein FliH
MTQPDSPRQPEDGPEPPDPLESLSERVRHAQETAERLVREANAEAQRAGDEEARQARRPPPRGYAVPEDEGRSTTADLQALVALLDLGRTLVPPELREQIAELVREILLLVRAIVDWYLERLDQRRKAPVEVEDIPIT